MSIRPTLTAALAVGLLGGLFSTACESERRSIPESERFAAQLSLYNASHDIIPVTLWGAAPDLQLDCQYLGDPLPDRLAEEHLQQLSSAPVLSGQELPISSLGLMEDEDGPGSCPFVIITSDDGRLPPIMVRWDPDLPERLFFSEVDAPRQLPTETPALVMDANYAGEPPTPFGHRPCDGDLQRCDEEHRQELLEPPSGASYAWFPTGDGLHVTPHRRADLEDYPIDDAEGSCTAGHQDPDLWWDDAPSGRWRIDEVSADDDCYELSLTHREDPEDQEDPEERRVELCGAPILGHHLKDDGDEAPRSIRFFEEDQRDSSSSSYHSLTLEVEHLDDEGQATTRQRLELVRGHALPDHLGLDWDSRILAQCPLYRELDGCAQLSAPMLLQIDIDDISIDVPRGIEQVLETEARRSIYVHRALHRLVTDQSCDPAPASVSSSAVGPYLELVYIGALRSLSDD